MGKLDDSIARRGLTLRETTEMVASALMVLRLRDGLPITDEQAQERANNVVQALLLYEVLKVRP